MVKFFKFVIENLRLILCGCCLVSLCIKLGFVIKGEDMLIIFVCCKVFKVDFGELILLFVIKGI